MRSMVMVSAMKGSFHPTGRAGAAKRKGEPKFSLAFHGALDRIRTCGTLLRRQVLYPLSYEGA